MGDRSSFLIITDRQELPKFPGFDLVTGLSMYSHWGGAVAVLDALTTCRDVGLNRVDDPHPELYSGPFIYQASW